MKCNFLLLTLSVFAIATRISPVPEPARSCSQSSEDSLYTLRFSPSLFVVTVHDTVRTNWNPGRCLRPCSRTSFIVACLLLLSGDVEINPGTGPRYPCGSCSKAVRSNQNEYTRLSSSDEGWCCLNCFKGAFPFAETSVLSCAPDDDLDLPVTSTHSNDTSNTSHSASHFKIIYTNCRSLTPNLDSPRAYASSCKPDVIALCETWLDSSITDCEIFYSRLLHY